MMKSAFGIFFLVAACNAYYSNVPLEVPGIRVTSRSNYSRSETTLSCPSGKTGFVCADCANWMACSVSPTPLYSNTCASLSSATPYCINDSCVADASDPKCSSTVTVPCTSKGVFPDPTDCTVYYSCDDVNAESVRWQCPKGYNFNPMKSICQYWGPCYKANCANNQNKFIIYPGNYAYYTFCSSPPTMYKCDDPINEIFDVKSMSCIFNCKGNGMNVDVFDCTKYVICDWYDGKYNVIKQSCGPGQYFDASKWQCVLGSCQSVIPTTTAAPLTTSNTGGTTTEGTTTEGTATGGTTTEGTTTEGTATEGTTTEGTTTEGTTTEGTTTEGTTTEGTTTESNPVTQ